MCPQTIPARRIAVAFVNALGATVTLRTSDPTEAAAWQASLAAKGYTSTITGVTPDPWAAVHPRD